MYVCLYVTPLIMLYLRISGWQRIGCLCLINGTWISIFYFVFKFYYVSIYVYKKLKKKDNEERKQKDASAKTIRYLFFYIAC